MMRILIFGMLAEDIGAEKIDISDMADTDTLRHSLLEKYPALAGRQFMMAVNMNKISGNTNLNPDDEIALIPPFAGG